jgi:hypothetical protein
LRTAQLINFLSKIERGKRHRHKIDDKTRPPGVNQQNKGTLSRWLLAPFGGLIDAYIAPMIVKCVETVADTYRGKEILDRLK